MPRTALLVQQLDTCDGDGDAPAISALYYPLKHLTVVSTCSPGGCSFANRTGARPPNARQWGLLSASPPSSFLFRSSMRPPFSAKTWKYPLGVASWAATLEEAGGMVAPKAERAESHAKPSASTLIDALFTL
jgi:hypothetical protein